MARLYPSSLPGSKVYFTDADATAQKRAKVRGHALDERLKLLCLLNEHVIVATAHIFESGLTYKVLLQNRALLESGVVVPALRTDARDFQDVSDRPRLEHPMAKRYAGATGKEIANFLESNSGSVVSWSARATQHAFRESLLRDLSVTYPSLATSSGMEEGQYGELLRTIAGMERMSRSNIVRAMANIPNAVRADVLRCVDVSYYLAGASAVESDPVLGSARAVRYVADKVANAAVATTTELASDPRLFREMLGELHVSEDILLQLTDRDILRLRDDGTLQEFRRVYTSLTEKVRNSIVSSQLDTLEAGKDAARVTQEAKRIIAGYVREERRREAIGRRSASVRIKALRWSGYATAFASLLSLPVVPAPLRGEAAGLAAASGIAGTALQVLDPLLQKILVEPKRGELIVFATRLLDVAASRET